MSAPQSMPVKMKPLPSATMTCNSGKPFSTLTISVAKVAAGNHMAKFDLEQSRDRREKGERDGGCVFWWRGEERLAHDVERDEDQNGREHGARDEVDDEADVAEDAAETDEDSGENRVADAAAHAL